MYSITQAGRAALSEWQEADSESARALLTAFVDGRLKDLTVAAEGAPESRARRRVTRSGRRAPAAPGRRGAPPGDGVEEAVYYNGYRGGVDLGGDVRVAGATAKEARRIRALFDRHQRRFSQRTGGGSRTSSECLPSIA